MQRKIYNLSIHELCIVVGSCIVNQCNPQSQNFFKECHSFFYSFCTTFAFCNELHTKQCRFLFRQLTSYCSSLQQAVSEKNQNRGRMGEEAAGRGGGLRTYFFLTKSMEIQVSYFTPKNSRQNEASPLEFPKIASHPFEIPRSISKSRGNST